ncbi:MAG: type I restriction enzyme HsdR N-terminal domain-containing protein [Planctomycetota bacterium]
MKSLPDTVRQLARRISNLGARRLNEQNTKATLIEPLLRALKWDVEDIDEVQREFRTKKSDKPVDYALLTLRTPRLFVEAKSLGENLDDRRWSSQIMGYATVAGVEWVVLTDGDEYRIFNTHAPVAVDEKLFRRVRLSSEPDRAAATLELLSKDRIEENRIDTLWRAQFVDRQVKHAVESLFGHENDMLLVNHVLGATKNLTPEEVRASLRRCRLTLDFPLPVDPNDVAPPPTKSRQKAAKKAANTGESCSIADLIGAGLLAPGTELFKQYRKTDLRARVKSDGSIEFNGTNYASPSQAGNHARASVKSFGKGGKLPATNGWVFWRLRDSDGTEIELDVVRQRFVGSKGKARQA